MTFERPWAWALLALAVPIVLLHLHLMRRRLVEVSSLELWRDLIPDSAGRGGLKRLRDGVALACLLAALVGFTAAAAGPVMGHAASGPRRLAIVLDASASMNARADSENTRIHDALAAADRSATGLAQQDELSVWLAAGTSRLVLEPGRGRPSLLGRDYFVGWRIEDAPRPETLEPRGLATTTRLAVRAAPGVSNRPATVLVLTDAIGAESLKDVTSGDVDLRVGIIDDRPAKNAGIVAFDLDPADPTRVVVRVATTDGPAQPRDLFLLSGDKELARTPLLFDAAGNATAVLPLRDVANTGGLVEVRLVPNDDFPEDDTSRLMLPAKRSLAVAVIASSPSPFLVEALRAMPDVVDPNRTMLVAPGAPASAVAGADVVIVDVENGGTESDSVRSLSFGGSRTVEKPLLWGVGTHPVLAGVDLSPLRIERAALVEPRPGETTIIASAQGAVGVAGGDGAARRVAFGFRPDASTLPLEAAFPLLVRNAVRWLGTPRPAPRYVVAGESWPDGAGAAEGEPTGETVPYPRPGGPYVVRSRSGAMTVVRWVPPRGFRLSPASPVAAMSAADAVASLPDRHLDTDTRERFASWCAAAGAAALVLGALLLRPSVQTLRDAPSSPSIALAPPPPAASR